MDKDSTDLCARCGARRSYRQGPCRRCRKELRDGLETFQEVQQRMDLLLGIKRRLITTVPIPSEFNTKLDR
jgi:hypothetical protein